jgi:queuine tRNA-ribosyltransferase
LRKAKSEEWEDRDDEEDGGERKGNDRQEIGPYLPSLYTPSNPSSLPPPSPSLSIVFDLLRSAPLGRRGRIHTVHGPIETPFFLPVGTAGAMRGITLNDLRDLQAQVLLCNTYHLHLNPGEDVIEKAGGLHRFVDWEKPILTDSGGYQVFSLSSRRTIVEGGVHFRSHLNGDPFFLGPENTIGIQHRLGADIIMCLDECPPSTASRKTIETAVDRTIKWAKACKVIHDVYSQERGKFPLLFGIVQGGLHADLRQKCVEELVAIGFDGYAIGGLAVGEEEQEMYDVLKIVCPLLPVDQPRYLMGVGVLHQLRACVALGVDMFDCVLPMRVARHGEILLSSGEELKITNARFKSEHVPIDPDSPSDLSHRHLRSYLHHLFKTNERMAETIACKQNLGITLKVMRDLRAEIEQTPTR